ncbi:MAG: hypothetical protein FJ280_07800 [Planctomycetes bacterium]|nr:hypothetical protein [Planctomycetota bacterium]
MPFHRVLPEHRARALRFIQGEPSRELVWSFGSFTQTSYTGMLGPEPTYEARVRLHMQMDSCFLWHNASPYRETWEDVECLRRRQDAEETREWVLPEGRLLERRVDDQIVEFQVKNPKDLKTFTAMCRRLRVEPAPDSYRQAREIAAGGPYGLPPQPLALVAPASPVQELLQRVTGVETFYYLLADAPEAMEELLETLQENQRRRYRILSTFDADLWYQAENTSTTLISPTIYEQLSLPHIREFADAAHAAGKRAIVHMCGLLRGLIPLLRETGMDGIHSLTPPPVGDVPFDRAFGEFPPNFSILGRLNSGHWLGRSEAQMLAEFRRMVPPRLVQERPFVLWITGDSVDHIPRRDFESLKCALLRFRDELAACH